VIAHGKIVAEVVCMFPIALLAAAAVLLSSPAAFAQDDQPQTQAPAEAPPPPAVRYAVPRSSAPARAPEPARQAEPERVPIQRAAPTASADAQERRTVPRGSRPREDNPPTGTAVPRAGTERPPLRPPDDRGPRVVDRGPRVANRGVYGRPTVYNNYYYYPRRSYPYGYGAFGLGYFYYDPYRWSDRNYSVHIGAGSGYPYYGGYYGGGYYGSGGYYPRPGYPIGELRLRVTPRHAQVFVDGYYAGVVDDFDGIVQSLKLEDGPYRIELVAPGYEPLEFDVRILPGQKITYRGDLLPQRP
jgi:hypothetical protein